MIRNPRLRQVHLDFHTSEYIPDVAKNFDALAFAKQFKEAHVNSVTIFSKCHHGMHYFPTKVGTQHPALHGRDLLGEMIEALHQQDIKAPVYTTVGWEEQVAHNHLKWRQMKMDGTFANVENSSDGVTKQPGGWKFNNWLHPDYQDYFESHLLEILDNYPVDGFFIDIVFFHPQGGWSEESRKFREKHGVIEDTLENHFLFEAAALEQFTARFSKLIQDKKPDASIFYNSPNNLYASANEGALRKAPWQTHFEIESLPSGFWGYYHFPRLARRLAHKGKFWLGMTGKFQKMWGDFGGIKPQPALEYECFRTQALGGGNSVGDQLHPRGVLDGGTYQLIGNVYKQLTETERVYEGTQAMPQIGILCPNHPALNETDTARSEEGCVLLLEELHYDCAVIDDGFNFSDFACIILPDHVVLTSELRSMLKTYLKKGGRLVVSYRSGFDAQGKWVFKEMPCDPAGEQDLYPAYWKLSDKLDPGQQGGERVIYQRGLNITPKKGARILVHRILPYFKRTDVTFCSHFQTPPDKPDPDHPAVIETDQVVYFADPVFREYRQSGNLIIRTVLSQVLKRQIGPPLFGEGLSPSILLIPRKRDRDLVLTLLNYIAVRKAIDIDVIDQRISFQGEQLKLPDHVACVHCVTTQSDLKRKKDGRFILPDVKGRIILEIPRIF